MERRVGFLIKEKVKGRTQRLVETRLVGDLRMMALAHVCVCVCG